MGLALACLSLPGLSAAADVPQRHNVVLIVSDYMGYRDTEPFGATDIRTPALSQLAAEGVKMTNFYAAAPVCGPARAALYTGQYPARIGFETNISAPGDGLNASITTLPRWLNKAGYKTALFGKWHLGYGAESTPNAHGFDEFFGHHAWTIGYYTHKDAQGAPGLYENEQIVEQEGYLTDLLTERAVKFIKQNQAEPFFLTLAYNAALPPYQPPELPESEWNDGWDVNQASRTDYVQMVERMDYGIGEVLGTLETLELAENTLVIYLYDHGGRHLVDSTPFFHGFANLWEGGIRVPLLLRMPGILPAGITSTMNGIAMDVTATILSAAGLADDAATLDGINLVPYLDGTRPAIARDLFGRADLYDFGKQRAMLEGKWKYVEHGNTQFLFDLSTDMSERHSQFSKQPAIVNRLRAKLDEWQDQMSLQAR
jgi:arylsulfatase A-like enzyme